MLAIVASSYLAAPAPDAPTLQVTKEMTKEVEAKVMKMEAGEAVVMEVVIPDPVSC